MVRLIKFGSSWAAPVDIERIATAATDTQVAAVQVQELDGHDPEEKVIVPRREIVADSRYEEQHFLGIFEHVQHTFGLMRLHSNRVLYEEPPPKSVGSRGAPRKHGKPFKLNGSQRAEDRSATFQLGKQTVRVRAWSKLHFKKLATLIGTLVPVEFLKEDGTPRSRDRCGYSGPVHKVWRFQICAGCIFGVSPLSTCFAS